MDEWRSISGGGGGNDEIFSSLPPRPDRIWGPTSHLSDWYRWLLHLW